MSKFHNGDIVQIKDKPDTLFKVDSVDEFANPVPLYTLIKEDGEKVYTFEPLIQKLYSLVDVMYDCEDVKTESFNVIEGENIKKITIEIVEKNNHLYYVKSIENEVVCCEILN